MRVASLLPTALAALPWMASLSAARTFARETPPSVMVVQGKDTVQASLSSGDSVTVYLHGATVTSWMTSDGDEKLFLSTASALNGTAGIRGGIPVVFPNFGTAPKNHQTTELPSHGFARNSTWTYAGNTPKEDGTEVLLTFTLSSTQLSAEYQKDWPHAAELVYTVKLSPDTLTVHFSVENKDTVALDFQFLLHSYLSTPVSKNTPKLSNLATNPIYRTSPPQPSQA